MAIGFWLGRGRRDTAGREESVLDVAVLDWLLPIAVLYNISNATWTVHAMAIVSLCVAVTLVDASLTLVLTRAMRIEDPARQTLLVVAPLGNTAFFGLSAVVAVLGPAYLADAIVFDQLGTTLMLATYGNIIARGSLHHVRADAMATVTGFRPLWGLVGGAALSAVGLHLDHAPLEQVGQAVTSALLPVSMLALGMKLAVKGLLLTRAVALGVLVRVVLGPAVLLGLVWGLGIATPELSAGLLQTAMPPMIAAALLAERRGLDGTLAFSLCGLGLVAAFCILPIYGSILT